MSELVIFWNDELYIISGTCLDKAHPFSILCLLAPRNRPRPAIDMIRCPTSALFFDKTGELQVWDIG